MPSNAKLKHKARGLGRSEACCEGHLGQRQMVVIGVPEEEREIWTENIFEEKMDRTTPKLMKHIYP